MSNRSDLTAILADIDDTISRVRDLSSSPGRAAALQCLADARGHLESINVVRFTVIGMRADSIPPSATGPAVVPKTRAELLETYPPRDSTPPSATDNQRARAEISRSFRRTHEILKGIK